MQDVGRHPVAGFLVQEARGEEWEGDERSGGVHVVVLQTGRRRNPQSVDVGRLVGGQRADGAVEVQVQGGRAGEFPGGIERGGLRPPRSVTNHHCRCCCLNCWLGWTSLIPRLVRSRLPSLCTIFMVQPQTETPNPGLLLIFVLIFAGFT